MILDDGYTETLPEFPQFRFRRFISRERKHFRELLIQERFQTAREFFSTHISDPDGRRVPTDLIAQEVAFAVTSNPDERGNIDNLKSGMRLMLTNPRLAIRPCSLCQAWWFDEDTGCIVQVGDQKLKRPAHAVTACQTERGCSRGSPDNLKAFNERNQQAFDHWMQWRSVGCPAPQDAILRRNWMWFESLKENHGLRESRTRLPQSKDRRGSLLHGQR